MPEMLVGSDSTYRIFLKDFKAQIAQSHIAAARAVTRAHVGLYWELGKLIVDRKAELSWGQAVVERLAQDLRLEYPDVTGFSPQNLWLMRQFYMEYEGFPILQQLVGELPWGHNVLIIQRVKDEAARRYYLEAAGRFGWTRNVLLNQIKAAAYEYSLANKTHNFPAALPAHQAEQAEEALKSRYSLEFLGIAGRIHERVLERRLVSRLRDFLVELGYGFCYIGNQHRLRLGSNEYYVDLLFYHRFLKCLVAIDLKTGRFRPEYAGKMDFYLDLLNETERASDDKPSIGIILCAERDRLEVEFSLKSKLNPIGVADYQLHPQVPEGYRQRLPSKEEWQKWLEGAQPIEDENG